ncbi:MAG: alcohol dehydrogenase catalytic domain-containing protein [Armatimonadota bacterium]
MSQKLDTYVKAQGQLPATCLQWRLYGAGLENFGINAQPEEIALPEPADDQLLLRTDAIGICFSDVKVVKQGNEHARLVGRDMKADPVVLGHEAHVTVAKVGKNLAARYNVGDRFIVQADVFYKGVSMAYGYVLHGAMTQYGLVGKEITDGDDGSYLLPVKDTTGYVEAALVEPWACVVDSYDQHRRNGIKDHGTALVVVADGADGYTLGSLANGPYPAVPSRIVAVNLKGSLYNQAINAGLNIIKAADLAAAKELLPKGADDVMAIGNLSEETVEEAAALLGVKGLMWVARTQPFSRNLSLDLGRIHYDQLWFTGTFGTDISKAAQPALRSDIQAGSKIWLVGAGGPMGQMHLQRAVQMSNPPAVIVASDVDDVRMEYARNRYAKIAEAAGVKLVFLNPKTLGNEAFAEALNTATDGTGFDYISCMVPVAPIVSDSFKSMGKCSVMNLFAGLGRGTMGNVDYNLVCGKGARLFGSSGSSIDSISKTLNLMEIGELKTRASLAAIGGMTSMWEGLKAVMENKFSGKTVIIPNIELPLMSVQEIKEKLPTVYAKLEDGKFWTVEAEQELLELML